MIKTEGQVTIMQELEMLALLVAVESSCPKWTSHRFVAFTNDSEAVRGSFLKTWTHNGSNNRLLARVFKVEEGCGCQVWLERVPSQPNPSDYLSRHKTKVCNGLVGGEVDLMKAWLSWPLNWGESATNPGDRNPIR